MKFKLKNEATNPLPHKIWKECSGSMTQGNRTLTQVLDNEPIQLPSWILKRQYSTCRCLINHLTLVHRATIPIAFQVLHWEASWSSAISQQQKGLQSNWNQFSAPHIQSSQHTLFHLLSPSSENVVSFVIWQLSSYLAEFPFSNQRDLGSHREAVG